MCYERIKCKIFFLARECIPKIRECKAISFFYTCLLASNERELFSAVFSSLLASATFNTEIKSRKESYIRKSACLQAVCESLAML